MMLEQLRGQQAVHGGAISGSRRTNVQAHHGRDSRSIAASRPPGTAARVRPPPSLSASLALVFGPIRPLISPPAPRESRCSLDEALGLLDPAPRLPLVDRFPAECRHVERGADLGGDRVTF